MATTALSVEELFISVAFSAVIGVVWGILGYYRARGQGEAFSWNKLAQSIVFAGAAGAGFYLINRELPSEQNLLLIAPAIIGITASAEKATRSVQAQAAGTYIPYTEPRVLFFNTDLYATEESARCDRLCAEQHEQAATTCQDHGDVLRRRLVFVEASRPVL